MATSITLLIFAIAAVLFGAGWVWVPLIFVVCSAAIFSLLHKKITDTDVAIFLNRSVPELQESSGLLLKPQESLNLLEHFQLQRVETAIDENIRTPKKIVMRFRNAVIFLLASLLVSFVLYSLPAGSLAVKRPAGSTASVLPETKLPQVDEVTVTLTPPSYTGKKAREQNRFHIMVEENGAINWHIATNQPVKEVSLVFNDQSILVCEATGKGHTNWTTGKQVSTPGFYQVRIDGALSELYRIEMIKDQVPVIIVQSPKPNTVIEPGQPQRTEVLATVEDDYGIRAASITATIASGKAEGVRFKEQTFTFDGFSAGRRSYSLKKTIDLRALGMKPGDELYFYISATDTYGQEKRSDISIVRIEDTAQLMDMEGLASGTDIKPEFFRSQRQIIIETEQLLKGADTMSAEAFRNRSNDLGMDQKLLRLRYGKFLGEETDNEIGGDHDHAEEGHADAEMGNARKMMDEIAHKHDQAEDAGFFDAQTKKQLKATLAEMWKAELQLRTIKPKDALPFEYQALKLLKELQQQSRVYVGKTGTKTTPLSPGKRLTGELDKIIQPMQEQAFSVSADVSIVPRKALGILEQVKNHEPLFPGATELLEQAGMQLGAKAAAEPSLYLSSLEALRRILQNKYSVKDISLAGNGLQRMIAAASKLPRQAGGVPDMKLSQRYFLNLNRGND
jgi:hypothetical protein